MKKLSYLLVALLFLGFMTFYSCKNASQKKETTPPAETEVVEEEVEIEKADTVAKEEEVEEEKDEQSRSVE